MILSEIYPRKLLQDCLHDCAFFNLIIQQKPHVELQCMLAEAEALLVDLFYLPKQH